MHKEISPSACYLQKLVLFPIICNGFNSLVWFGRPAGGETPRILSSGGGCFFFCFSSSLDIAVERKILPAVHGPMMCKLGAR